MEHLKLTSVKKNAKERPAEGHWLCGRGIVACCFFVSLFFSLVFTKPTFVATAWGQETGEETEESYLLHEALRAGKNEEVVRLIGVLGKKVLLQPDSYGMLPLHYASSTGNFEIGSLLLERYAIDPNIRPPGDNDWVLRGRTPLHMAVTSASLDFVMLLADKGANLFAGDRNGVLPMHLAVQYGRIRVAKFLMRRMDKKVHAFDSNKTTPLHLAAQYGRGVLAAHLITLKAKVTARNGFGLTPLHYAAAGGHEEVVELLIENGAQTNATNKLGVTPLFMAARDDRRRVVSLLLSEKSIKTDTKNLEGMTALTVALANGNGDVSSMLLKYDFDPRLQDKSGKTVLHHAASGGEIKILRVILKKASADLNSVDNLGNSPLHYATEAGKTEAVKELRKAGADINQRNKNNETAQDIAKDLGNVEVLSALR